MVDVQGRLGGVRYEVEVTGRATEPVVGSKAVAMLVRRWAGQTIAATPTGPTYTVDGSDVASILALLHVETDVTHVGRGAPKAEPLRTGVIH